MHPILAFCPYLSLSKPIGFADWRLGPLSAFEELWADARFKVQAEAFVRKFVDNSGESIDKPSVLCRRNGKIDGQLPTPEEQQALELAIGFGFLDRNRRRDSNAGGHGWMVVTADNTELHFWPIDVEAGNVTVTTGIMVKTISGGYQITDKELVIRPPLELHMPISGDGADPERLDAVYRVALSSLRSPGTSQQADRLATAIGWSVKAWRNTPSIRFPERVVFLKTAFEALTGTSDSREAVSTLGNFIAELATAEGGQSFHVVLFAAGGKINFFGLQDIDQRKDDPAFAVFASAARYPATVFDLRPIRRALHQIAPDKRSASDSGLLYWADTYDAIVCYRQVTPAGQ